MPTCYFPVHLNFLLLPKMKANLTFQQSDPEKTFYKGLNNANTDSQVKFWNKNLLTKVMKLNMNFIKYRGSLNGS